MKNICNFMRLWSFTLAVILCLSVTDYVQAADKKVNEYVLTSAETSYSDGYTEKSVTVYSYNSNGLLAKSKLSYAGENRSYLTKISYNKNNLPVKSTYVDTQQGNAVLKMSYDKNGRLTVRKRLNGTGTTVFTNKFTYDTKGRVKSITTPETCGFQPKKSTFQYNSKGQLTKMRFGSYLTATYKYDDKGNLTQEIRNGEKRKYKNTYNNGRLVKSVCTYPYTDYIDEKEVTLTMKVTTMYKYKKVKVNKSLQKKIQNQQWALKNDLMPQIYFLSFWSY